MDDPLNEGLSNFDHRVPAGLADALKAGGVSQYTGWEFYGDNLRYEDGHFRVDILRYSAPQGTVTADTLESLMREVSERFGYK